MTPLEELLLLLLPALMSAGSCRESKMQSVATIVPVLLKESIANTSSIVSVNDSSTRRLINPAIQRLFS